LIEIEDGADRMTGAMIAESDRGVEIVIVIATAAIEIVIVIATVAEVTVVDHVRRAEGTRQRKSSWTCRRTRIGLMDCGQKFSSLGQALDEHHTSCRTREVQRSCTTVRTVLG